MSQSWSPLHARLHQVLRSRQLLPKHQRILVAVSGGQDSLCLIQLLLDLQPKWGWQVAIAHCNHRWRTDADANAEYVRGLAQTWGVPYHGLTVTETHTASVRTEAGARQWRYQVLAETAIAQGYGAIATGHTASDRAETLLYNLMRGSGTDGLQALTWQRSLPLPPIDKGRAGLESSTLQPPKNNITIVRPLLFMTRQETGEFCQSASLQPWLDSTNDDWRYARNRIRQDLLPYLQEHFNPGVEHNLAQTAEILQADVAYLEAETDKLWHQVVDTNAPPNAPTPQLPDPPTPRPPNSPTPQLPNSPTPQRPNALKLNRKLLTSAPLALQRRVLRRGLLSVLPKAPNFEQIEKLAALVTAPNRSQTDPFPGGAIARVAGDWIVVET
ncbi:MAG: tRNA lysidine(34) synthetase TilS [Cyanobacteria bacterium P01_F01_bin.150]